MAGIIGKDAALRLAEDVHVVGTVPSKEAAAALQGNPNITALVCAEGSAACLGDLAAALKAQGAKGRHITGLVACDGVLPRDVARADLGSGAAAALLEEATSTNVIQPLRTVGALMQDLEKGVAACGIGRIVLVGSLAGVVSLPKHMAFAGAAGALERVADTMRQLLQGSGIFVSLVQPGFVERGGKDGPWHQRAMATGTTTPAIFEALMAPRPQARYPCAAAFGLPTNAIAALAHLLPDALMDALAAFLEASPAPARAKAEEEL